MDKILTPKKAIEIVKKIKQTGGKIILVGGCFDILHEGHIEFLQKSKKIGGTLFVFLENDKTIQRLKGSTRPVNRQVQRAIILSILPIVDYIILLPEMKNDNDYAQLVSKIKPDFIPVTDNDPKKEQKEKQANSVNGKVAIVIKRIKNYSTSKIIEASKIL